MSTFSPTHSTAIVLDKINLLQFALTSIKNRNDWLIAECKNNSPPPTELVNFINTLQCTDCINEIRYASFNFCYLSNRNAAFYNRFPYKSGNSRPRNYGCEWTT